MGKFLEFQAACLQVGVGGVQLFDGCLQPLIDRFHPFVAGLIFFILNSLHSERRFVFHLLQFLRCGLFQALQATTQELERLLEPTPLGNCCRSVFDNQADGFDQPCSPSLRCECALIWAEF